MGSSHNFTDNVIRELPMEIHMAFYPPPTIRTPDLNIPSLRRYEYKFDRERAAILRYEEEQQARHKLRNEEEEAKSAAEKAELSQIEEPTIAKDPSSARNATINSRQGPSTSTLPLPLPNKQQHPEPLDDFSEFEAKRDPFELVELHSLDDRGELEKLLMGMQMNTTAAANGHSN